MPLALNLRAYPRQHFMAVDRANEIVVHAHIESTQETSIVTRLDHDDHRQMAGSVERTNLTAQAQTIGCRKTEAHHQQIKVVLGHTHQRGLNVAIEEHIVCCR